MLLGGGIKTVRRAIRIQLLTTNRSCPKPKVVRLNSVSVFIFSIRKKTKKINMKVIFVVALVFAVAYSADEKKEAEKSEDRPKTFKRLIPADVLRDFPGMCFASTLCATVEVGKTWELTPFCGRSTCVLEAAKPPQGLLESIEDCGPLPLANPKCKLDEEKTNKTAAFPDCCPQFKCEEGAKLEFPEITTEAPFP